MVVLRLLTTAFSILFNGRLPQLLPIEKTVVCFSLAYSSEMTASRVTADNANFFTFDHPNVRIRSSTTAGLRSSPC